MTAGDYFFLLFLGCISTFILTKNYGLEAPGKKIGIHTLVFTMDWLLVSLKTYLTELMTMNLLVLKSRFLYS